MPVARRGRRVTAPVNWHTPEFGVTAESPAAARELLTRAFSLARTVELSFVDPAVVAVARSGGHRVASRTIARAAYVGLEGDWERALSKNRRKELRRQWRRLEERGEVGFEVHRDAGLLDEAFAVEASGWKGQRGTAIVSDDTVRRFYTEVFQAAAERGALRLSLLRLDGQAISAELCLAEHGRWYSLKSGYDEAFRELGPGRLHLHRLMQHAAGEEASAFELLGDVDEYKLSWTDTVHERCWVLATRNPLVHAGYATRERIRPLARRIRRRSTA